MNINKIISHLSKFEVTHQKEAEDSCVAHYFSRLLPEMLGGRMVVGNLETRDGETEIPTKEAEALYRRLWLLQEYPEV